jgi:hypothetical protein
MIGTAYSKRLIMMRFTALLVFDEGWYHHPGSNGGPLDPQSSALTN